MASIEVLKTILVKNILAINSGNDDTCSLLLVSPTMNSSLTVDSAVDLMDLKMMPIILLSGSSELSHTEFKDKYLSMFYPVSDGRLVYR